MCKMNESPRFEARLSLLPSKMLLELYLDLVHRLRVFCSQDTSLGTIIMLGATLQLNLSDYLLVVTFKLIHSNLRYLCIPISMFTKVWEVCIGDWVVSTRLENGDFYPTHLPSLNFPLLSSLQIKDATQLNSVSFAYLCHISLTFPLTN